MTQQLDARTRRRALPFIVSLLLAGVAGVAAAEDLDVVFVLDTTGSMSGEIREAKERIHQLAFAIGEQRVGATVRYGVVAFRDRGDEYLTRISALDADVTGTSRFLAKLTAGGGGDGPEDVVGALQAAVDAIGWDPVAEHRVVLVGDAPPHLDYDDNPAVERLIEALRERRIVVDAIGCRSLAGQGVDFFREVAHGTEGRYQHIGRVSSDADLATAFLGAVGDDGVEVASGGQDVHLSRIDRDDRPARALQVRRVDAPSGSQSEEVCALEVALPDGLALLSSPSARQASDGLHVVLDLGPGRGGRETYTFEACPPETPIHVELGE